MMVYILTVYLLFVASHHYAKSSSMCSSSNINPERRLALLGYNNDIGPCECQITLQTFGSKPDFLKNIDVTKTHFPVGCDYNLLYWLGGNTTKIKSSHENCTFTMDLYGSLYVQMENKVIGSGALCFNITVTSKSNDYKVDAKCENLNKNTETTSPTTTSTITTPTTVTPYPETYVVSQTDDNVSRKVIEQTVSPTNILSTRDQTTIQATKEKIDNDKTDDDNSLLPIILGCSVGGTVVIILVIVGCVSFRRRHTTTHSNTKNNKHGEMIINDNDLYISSDSIPMNNNQQGTNSTAEMEIIPNDLYQSSDSLADDLNDSTQHEHVPGQIEHVPNTDAEYAVVKKRPKKISNTDTAIELNTSPNKVNADYDNVQIEKYNLKIEIDRIVGPKGDEYTLVNKY